MIYSYLDTCALRSIGASPPRVGDGQIPGTSALAVAELVRGATRDQAAYRRIRPAFRHLASDWLRIDWRFPEQIFLESFLAFGNVTVEELRAELLREIIVAANTTENFAKFQRRVSNIESSLFGGFFSDYVDRLGKGYAEVIVNALQSEVLKRGRQELLELMSSPDYRSLSYSMGLKATVDATLRLTSRLNHGKTEEEVYDSFTGDIDLYIRASSWATDDLLRHGKTPERNDGVDMAHFLYITPGMFLLTSDKRMKKIAEEIDHPALSLETEPREP